MTTHSCSEQTQNLCTAKNRTIAFEDQKFVLFAVRIYSEVRMDVCRIFTWVGRGKMLLSENKCVKDLYATNTWLLARLQL